MDTQALGLVAQFVTLGKTVYDIAQNTSKLEDRQPLMAVYGDLMALKRLLCSSLRGSG